jgi:tetratricopeptide (TPR) repeat protein
MRSVNQSPKTSLEYFKKVFDAKTFGTPEAREQLMSASASVINSDFDVETKQIFAEFAYKELTKQAEDTPYDARYQYFAGIFLNNMNQYAMALPYMQKAVELSPKKLTMMFELAKTYAYLGEREKALEINEYAYNLVPEYSLGKINYAAALILNGREAEAKKLLGDEPITNEIVIRMYLIRASAYIKDGNKNLAIAEVQKAIKMVPGFKEQGDTVIKGILDGSIK